MLMLQFDEAEIDGSKVSARQVKMVYGEYELQGGLLQGDLEGELTFTGSPSLQFRSQVLYGDTIRFHVREKTYRVENLRSALTPEFLQNRTLAPIYVSGGSVAGRDQEPVVGRDAVCTTCDRTTPHYHIEAASITVEPGKRLVLRKAAIAYQGRRLVVLPTLVVPLDRRIPRGGYQPYFGHTQEEGWFVKTAFNYVAGPQAPGLYNVDVMEKKGLGLGVQQAWSTPSVMAEAEVYGIVAGPQGTNYSARTRSRVRLGSSMELTLGFDARKNDYRTLPDTEDRNYRIGLSRRVFGSETVLNLTSRSTTSGVYRSSSETANLIQRFELSRSLSLSLNADYSRYSSGSAGTLGSSRQITERLNTRLQADYRASHYSLQLVANKDVPIGKSQAPSYFGGVERLPELTLSRYRLTRGPLASAPLYFNLAAGKFSEGGLTGTNRTTTERFTTGFDFGTQRYALSRTTDLDVSFSFTQHVYGEGAAQYILRSTNALTQRWGRRSGLAFRHTYQQPHGGTPFRFDRQSKYHMVTLDAGLLDDERFQLTARAGYDLGRSEYVGYRQPWQTVSANLFVRPLPWLSMRQLATYDPNMGQLVSLTSDLRLRGRNDFALDLVSRYDPRSHRFGQVNAYLNLPVLPTWRVVALTQYNGYLKRFESRNLQIIHDMHCLEASFTFIDQPYGWRANRQVIFQIRIKAFPVFQQFGTGLYGQAIDTSVGEWY